MPSLSFLEFEASSWLYALLQKSTPCRGSTNSSKSHETDIFSDRNQILHQLRKNIPTNCPIKISPHLYGLHLYQSHRIQSLHKLPSSNTPFSQNLDFKIKCSALLRRPFPQLPHQHPHFKIACFGPVRNPINPHLDFKTRKSPFHHLNTPPFDL